ncbi:unnamed protein product [Sphagnum troendelagicum]|uniref:Uncharacterized protein n=1 Tax=Sphagnum troendelagicum TaxID=128251 RepID=A0ABP0URL7_9BRYO
MDGSLVAKHSCQTKVEMAVVKVEKAITKEACEVKKLAKQVTTTELGSTKKLSKTPKGEKEETDEPLNPESGERGASMEKESSKGEAFKDNVEVVE